MWDFQHPPHAEVYSSRAWDKKLVGDPFNGPISGRTECPRNLARIGSNLALIPC